MKDLHIEMQEDIPLRDVVFKTLRHAILRGELAPGERLMELSLAQKLGVSRTPIREAIRMLELDGLVTMIPRKGAAVARITEKDLQDVLEVRCALEELAVELACIKITTEQLDELKKVMKAFCEASQGKDVTFTAETDVRFHDVIFAATNNKRLIQLLSNLREQMYRYRVEYLKDPDNYAKLIDEHARIYDCLEKRKPEEARRAVKQHIVNQVAAVSRSIKEK